MTFSVFHITYTPSNDALTTSNYLCSGRTGYKSWCRRVHLRFINLLILLE